MKKFEFIKANSFLELLKIKAELKNNAILTAGGTCVMNDIRAELINNVTLVSISDIDAKKMHSIYLDNGKISIGALAKINDIGKNALIEEYAPALYMAAQVFADPTTRNSATIGGNVAYASPAADTVPPLMVHEATVVLAHMDSHENEVLYREIPIDEFYVELKKTIMQDDEIIERFILKPTKNSGYIKLGLRKSMAISIATAAARVSLKDGIIENAIISLGAVSKTVVRAKTAENAIIGRPWNAETAKLLSVLISDISPVDDIRATKNYRNEIAPVLAKRAINLALYRDCNFQEELK
ncbi:MAG: FAD binding domain-containing protein [Clostridia bacterium]